MRYLIRPLTRLDRSCTITILPQMKFKMFLGSAFAMTTLLFADPAPTASQPAAPSNAPIPLSPTDQLTGPIALYPDPLVALILPASTFPSDIAAAAAYLKGGGNPTQINAQPWNSSVKGLAHYPTVLQWMAENPEWTAALGSAFADSPSDVMASIQKLRGTAKAAGTLGNTPEQTVVTEGGSVSIEPAQPTAIYVPVYEPDVVFVNGPYFRYGGPFLYFGAAFPIGPWLGYHLEWGSHAIWHGNWRNWYTARGWGHPIYPGQPGFIHPETGHIWTAPHHAGGVHARALGRGIRPRLMRGARAPRPPHGR